MAVTIRGASRRSRVAHGRLAEAGEQVGLRDWGPGRVTRPDEGLLGEWQLHDRLRDLAEPRVGDLAGVRRQRVTLALENRGDVHLRGDPRLGLGDLTLLLLGHLPLGHVLAASRSASNTRRQLLRRIAIR